MTKSRILWGLLIITVGLVLAAVIGNETATWRRAPQPSQDAVQPPDGQESELGHSGAVEASPWRSGLPRCLHEDGNPDGRPCLWVDPRTGEIGYRSSSEYRQ